MRDVLAPLRQRDFRLLFAGRTVSFAGTAMANIALAFAVLSLGGDASDLGLVLALATLPAVGFLLVGGILADRLPRHHLMVGANVASGTVQALVALLLLTGQAEIWHLAVAGLVRTVAQSFFWPAQQAIVPQVVPAAQLQQANALLRTTLNSAQIGGAAAGGAIVALAGPGWAIAVDAASYFAAAVLLMAMRVGPPVAEATEPFVRAFRVGWREFASRTWVWVVVIGFALVNGAESAALNVLGPIVAERSLGGAAVWGLVLAASGVGLVLGAIIALRYRPTHPIRVGILATFPLALPVALLAIEAPWPLIALGILVASMGIELFGVLWDTSLQAHVPNDVLSRVAAWDAVGSIVLMPVAYVVVGPIASAFGLPTTLWGCATLILVATALQLLSREARNLRRVA